MTSKPKTARVIATLPDALIRQMDAAIDATLYKDRTHAIHQALALLLNGELADGRKVVRDVQ